MAGLRPFIAFVILAACSANQTPREDRVHATTPADTSVKLASSLQVEVAQNEVRLVFHITNPTNQPVVLEFATGQRYDFAVRAADGSEVWRWSADRMFTQALGTETIPAGGTLNFSQTWAATGRSGVFTAIAELKALNQPLEQRTIFEIRPR